MQELGRTWFLLPDGTIDEIDMVDRTIGAAHSVALQLNAQFFWRCLSRSLGTMDYVWGCYRADRSFVTWKGAKIAPFKVVRSPDSSAAEMICRIRSGAS